MVAEPLLLGALLFVAAAAGWFGARLGLQRPRRRAVPPAEFFRGLDHVLRDDSDKALNVLQGLADADPGVVEIHFALATLFRRRGETDRAIRIHQNLLARPDLARAHREQALFDLAEDYHRAGLFDRAEALYSQLVDENINTRHALDRLVSIYERQRDWDQAIAARRHLARSGVDGQAEVIAQYHCEQAEAARERGDLATMRSTLKLARSESNEIVRGALMRADLAVLRKDSSLALTLYRRVLELHPRLAAVVLQRLVDCCKTGPAASGLDDVLKQAIRRNPDVGQQLGLAVLATGLNHSPIAAAAARDVLAGEAALARLLENGSDIDGAASVLQALGLARLEYRCAQCGYRATELNWQCPACSHWDSSRPDIRLKAPVASD